MNNLDFFNISLLNTKINYDFSSPAGKVVIPKTKEETNDLIEANHNLIDLITTYKTLQKCSPNSGELTAIVNEIIKLLDSTKYINYTSFCVDVNLLESDLLLFPCGEWKISILQTGISGADASSQSALHPKPHRHHCAYSPP